MQDSLARCTVPIKPSTLKKLAPWTQDTASDGVAGWDALSRKYESCVAPKPCGAPAFLSAQGLRCHAAEVSLAVRHCHEKVLASNHGHSSCPAWCRDTFSLQEKIANSAFNGANSVPGAHDDPVLAGAFKQGARIRPGPL